MISLNFQSPAIDLPEFVPYPAVQSLGLSNRERTMSLYMDVVTKGTLPVDKRYRDVGRIQLRSGTTDRDELKAFNGMLDNLFENGRFDVLRAIKNRTVSLKLVYHHYRKGTLHRLATVEHVLPLDPNLLNWIADYPKWEDNTRKRYRQCAEQLILMNRKGSVNDLPAMVRRYWKYCADPKRQFSRAFNQTRAVVLSYIGKEFGKSHPLYAAVRDVPNFTIKNRREGKPLPVWQVVELMAKVKPHMADMIWTMCLTGMHWKEYSGDWEIFSDRVLIHGTKREQRNRVIPFLGDPTDPNKDYCFPAVGEEHFRDTLRDASSGTVQIYDLRRTYAFWLSEADINPVRQAAYMGHKVRGMTQHYQQHKVTEFLLSDAEKLKAYIVARKAEPVEVLKLASTPLLRHNKPEKSKFKVTLKLVS